MKKKLTVITLATAMVIGNPFHNSYSHAESTDDLKDIQEQREDIQKNLSSAEGKIAGILEEMEDLNTEIERVNQVLTEKQTQIEETEKDIDRTVSDIKFLQEEIKELETSIERRHEILKNRMASYQETGGSISYLEVIFGSSSFGDFISRVNSVNKIVESDASLMKQLENDIKKVEENKEKALQKLAELNTMKVEQEETLASITEEKQNIERNKAALESKQHELASLVEELETKDSNLASVEKEVKEQIAAAQREAEKKAKEEAKAQRASTDKTTKSEKKENSNLEHKSEVKESSKSSESPEEKQEEDAKVITVTATAYTVDCAGCTGITSTGINLKKNPNSKVIAVDPSVIPLGTLVHVEGYGYAIAGDVGSAIKGNKIDVYVPTRQRALSWGVRKVKVTIQ
ncbi:PcsB-like coiled-coil domain-containing protein [Oceanobacillus halophilus]|uniref:Uncharacterized protein n=1 Tax=Oceanobacillus halophilus TaxID=930130 RepID=A0A494ZTS1_9BACI|nr:3D domain-containing protein [Oceanobacillus halophilus]RKQ29648.1 hypothetical protein D8M06_17090 [Oceanobacillus halophilus]